MIVKLWPIRGKSGMKSCVDYVRDDTKVTFFMVGEDGTVQRVVTERPEDMENVIAYVSNPDKTQDGERTYVSGYECHPDHFAEQLEATRRALGVLETGPDDVLCYHMVQSFPKGLDISPEEAHQCGLELLQKMGAYQGIVCTHVNPVADEEGHLHGEQIHNHIVFSAYRLPDRIDPEHPNQLKFNRCNDTYDQLQRWNDEIAFEHGLPIVAELDASRIYDWNDPTNRTDKWRDRVRYDVNQAKYKARDWDDFKRRLEAEGYTVRDGNTVTYQAPDGVHRARASTLGANYTKNGLLMFWAVRDEQQKAMAKAMRAGQPSPFRSVYNGSASPLRIQIPMPTGEPYSLSLDRRDLSAKAIDSYFVSDRLYDVLDDTGRKVYTATGDEAKALLMELQRERAEGRENEEEIKRRARAMEQERRKIQQATATDEKARRSPYAAFYFNEDGSRKNTLELSLVVASLLIGQQFGIENKYTEAAKQIADQRHARDLRRQRGPDRRLQMMMDGIATVKQEGIQSEEDLNKAVNRAGYAYNKAKKAYLNTQSRIEKLQPLLRAFDDWEDTSPTVSIVQKMEDGPEKKALMEQYSDLFDRYNAARRVMYGFKTRPEQIEETRARVQSMRDSLPGLEEKLDAAKEELRRMKRTQYAYRLSHSSAYLAGQEAEPIRGPKQEYAREQTRTTTRTQSRDEGR